jgi:hypothetical protein
VPPAVAVAPVRVDESVTVVPTTIEVADKEVAIEGLFCPPLMLTVTTVELVMSLPVPPVPVNVTVYSPGVVPEIVTFTLPLPPTARVIEEAGLNVKTSVPPTGPVKGAVRATLPAKP